MKKYVKAESTEAWLRRAKNYKNGSNEDQEIYYDDCHDEVMGEVIDYIESGDAWSYDDVVSETYSCIQSYFENMGQSLSDKTEDSIYEWVMEDLDDRGLIDHKAGILIDD